MIDILPSIVPSSSDDIRASIDRYRAFAQAMHIDATNGTLAPNTTWMPGSGEKLPEAEHIYYEAHLMAKDPEAAGLAFLEAGAKRLIAHVESFDSETQATQAFASWRARGAQEIGIALLIDTPLEALEIYTLHCSSITVMSIANIGVQGIPFDERAYGRVADIHARYPDLTVEIDGGVGQEQIAALVRAGATRFSVGSAIAASTDPAQAYANLLSTAQGAVY